ncbi:NAC domain-containing protein [Filobasidium floriforme]|uniref:NAC domain-containing protein n=1 Tax=Filobasidium floriforme TaxID=5210 RepID=UPI001E8CCCFC|nr:NAC domain-containing protein [Filobasidium floriforme]KAH8089017.1 NAC domain-containing protein [Filobasidium floriforme]
MSIEELSINDNASNSVSVELSKNEKKSRKALEGLGLKKVEGITRVTLRRPRGVLMVVANPEVYKSPYTDCYIVFGEAKLEDNSSAAQIAAAQQVAASQQAAQASLASGGFGPDHPQTLEDLLREAEAGEDGAPELVSSDDKKDDKPASSDVEPDEKDIKLVMEQASVEREKAVKAIKEADGDLINASESEF